MHISPYLWYWIPVANGWMRRHWTGESGACRLPTCTSPRETSPIFSLAPALYFRLHLQSCFSTGTSSSLFSLTAYPLSRPHCRQALRHSPPSCWTSPPTLVLLILSRNMEEASWTTTCPWQDPGFGRLTGGIFNQWVSTSTFFDL